MLINELMGLDRALASTWKRYAKVVMYPGEHDPGEIDAFLDALEKADDAYLGYAAGDSFVFYAMAWHCGRGRSDRALKLAGQAITHGLRNIQSIPLTDDKAPREFDIEHRTPIHAWSFWSPEVKEGFNLLRAKALSRESGEAHDLYPLMYFEQCRLPVKSEVDYLDPARKGGRGGHCRKTLFKGDDVYAYRYYDHNGGEKLFSKPAFFDAVPGALANKLKFLGNGYEIEAFCGAARRRFQSPYLNRFVNTYQSGDLPRGDIDAVASLLNGMAAQRGGRFAYTLGTGPTIYDKKLQPGDHDINANSDGLMFELLWILKRCGYLDDIFEALPQLPDDFPLLLACFAEGEIRRRVEAYLMIPGLRSILDLALAPRRLGVKDQLKLVEFGARNPHFQELLSLSLHHYGHYLYNSYDVGMDWHKLDFAHFSIGWGGDLLLFLTSRADLLPPIREILEFGPGTAFAHESIIAEGFEAQWVYILRTLLGYLAYTRNPHLAEWKDAYPVNSWNEAKYRRTKLLEFVEAVAART